jgi:putative transposase
MFSRCFFPKESGPPRASSNLDQIPTLVFLTGCTDRRRRWLANDANHQLLKNVWLESTAWAVGTYILMPDHLHLFVWPYRQVTGFDHWVRYWKSLFTRRSRNRFRHWQPNCFHHRIRSCESADSKLVYMLANPVRAGLIARAEDWPYRGELFKSGFRW